MSIHLEETNEELCRKYETRKDYVNALKYALMEPNGSLSTRLKTGKFYRILGFPLKAIDAYLSALICFPGNSNDIYKQFEACLQFIYSRYLSKSEIFLRSNLVQKLFFPSSIVKCSQVKLRKNLVVYCNGNQAFREFLLKVVSMRFKIFNNLLLVIENVGSVDLLNLTRFVKIAKSHSLQRVHFRGSICCYLVSAILKGLEIDEIIFEDFKMLNLREALQIRAKKFCILGKVEENFYSQNMEVCVSNGYVGPLIITAKVRIHLSSSCTTLQGMYLGNREIKNYVDLHSLFLSGTPSESRISFENLSRITKLERLGLCGYDIEGSCCLPSLFHLELRKITRISCTLGFIQQNQSIRSIFIIHAGDTLKRELAECLCSMPKLEELIIVNCQIDIFFLEHISANYFSTTRKCLGMVNCGADDLVGSLAGRYPTRYVFRDEATFDKLWGRAWPETTVDHYYK